MNSIIIALSVLAIIFSTLKIIEIKRIKERKEIIKLYRKIRIKLDNKVKFNNGLRKFIFDENKNFPKFICFAMNEKNAKRKYKNFLQNHN